MKLSEYKVLATQVSQKLAAAAAVVVLLGGLGVQPAISALTSHSPEVDPNHQFPLWFQDSNGLILEMCLDPAMCTPDPVIPGNLTSVNSGFGAEAFFWSADANMTMPSGRALLVLALEAAYGGGDPAPNDQLLFGRVRIRATVPTTGVYKVSHPYLGADCQPEVINVTEIGPRNINVTRDIGSGTPFNTALNSEIGPFLVWDPAVAPAAPAGFVGNPAIEHEVINGRCDTNYFKIEGPAGVDLDGQGNNFVQTNLFSVQGKIFDGVVPPSLQPVRATYSRRTTAITKVTTSNINTFVNAPANATVTLLHPQTGANVPMTFDGVDTFFRGIRLNEATSIPMPEQVTVTATNPGGSTTLNLEITDLVNIVSATWRASTNTLRVVAVSSDKIAAGEGDPQPVLTLRFGGRNIPMPQVGAAGRYEVVVPGITVPPARVTVISSKGDSDTRRIGL